MNKLFNVQMGGAEAGAEQWKRGRIEVEKAALDTAEDAANYLLRKIRQNAHRVGKDWGEVADQGVVRRVTGNVVLLFPVEAADLETGTEGNPPRPIIRQTINQMDEYLKGFFNKTLHVRLFGTGDL